MSFNYEESIWGKGYASTTWSSPTSFRLNQAIQAISHIPAGGSVLELGCGAGQFIRTVKKCRPELLCYGSDISDTAIAAAKTADDGVVYIKTEAVLPYADDSLDAVLIFDVLEHVEDVDGILTEVYRVLKPGGTFYAFVPCEGDRLSIWHWCRIFGWKGDLTKRYAGHIQYFSRNLLRKLYVHNGFTQIRFQYSEHLLGQLLGFAAFNLMDRAARRQGLEQINGETYFEQLNNSVSAPGLLSAIKRTVNTLVYFESYLLRWLPSPNVHSVAKK